MVKMLFKDVVMPEILDDVSGKRSLFREEVIEWAREVKGDIFFTSMMRINTMSHERGQPFSMNIIDAQGHHYQLTEAESDSLEFTDEGTAILFKMTWL